MKETHETKIFSTRNYENVMKEFSQRVSDKFEINRIENFKGKDSGFSVTFSNIEEFKIEEIEEIERLYNAREFSTVNEFSFNRDLDKLFKKYNINNFILSYEADGDAHILSVGGKVKDLHDTTINHFNGNKKGISNE